MSNLEREWIHLRRELDNAVTHMNTLIRGDPLKHAEREELKHLLSEAEGHLKRVKHKVDHANII